MKKLSSVKREYDLLLKALENRPSAFRNDGYDVYFEESVFQDEIVSKMSDEDKKSYDNGAGGELKEHDHEGKMVPPSMSSVASSSRFCYLSLKDSDFTAFGIKNIKKNRVFEEHLPITCGTPPHMDCYLECENELCCFECKCHEQFDEHTIGLAVSYFKKDRIVLKIPEEFIVEKNKKVNKSIQHIISSKAFGINENPMFDIKQLLTHIMGIQARQEKIRHSKEKRDIPARLIYFYFIPDKVVNSSSDVNDAINQLYKEIETVFNCQIIKENIKNITLELYVQFSDKVETATKNNVRKITFNKQ